MNLNVLQYISQRLSRFWYDHVSCVGRYFCSEINR